MKGVVLDIDGVLTERGKPLPGAREALLALSRAKVPFVLLTNSSAAPENRAALINSIVQEELVRPEQVINNSSCFLESLPAWQEQGVVLLGSRKEAVSISLHRYITFQELSLCYPEFRAFRSTDPADVRETRTRVSERLRLKVFPEDLRSLGVATVLLLNTTSSWEEFYNSMATLLTRTREDKRLTWLTPEEAGLRIVCAAKDQFDPSGEGSIVLQIGLQMKLFEQVYKRHSGRDLKVSYFGKPEQATMECCERRVRGLGAEGQLYLVGDNPETDIVGGNSVGWRTVLVQSGIWRGTPLEGDRVPWRVEKTVREAVEQVLKNK